MIKAKLMGFSRQLIPRMLIGILCCVLGVYVIKEYITFPILQYFLGTTELAESIQNLLSGIVMVLLYGVIYTKLEDRKLFEFDLGAFAADLWAGLLGGFGVISLCILCLFVLGYYQVEGINSIRAIWLPLTVLISAALLEEIIFRAILYRILEDRFGTHIALLQALIFGVLHYGNTNATLTSVWFVILLGLILSLLYTYTQRLWLPFFFHLSWNFAQIFYGSTLSGDDDFKSLLSGSFNGPTFFIGSDFGIEDSFFSILFSSILALWLYWRCIRTGKLKGGISIKHKHR